MKKILIAVIAALVVFVATGCPSATLHNTPISYVTLSVVNMPMADGNYCFVGGFFKDGWANDKREFAVAGGAGTYDGDDCATTKADLYFSIVKPGSWERPFFPATKGNENDFGKMQNFKVKIPMDGQAHVITVDGSTADATISVE